MWNVLDIFSTLLDDHVTHSILNGVAEDGENNIDEIIIAITTIIIINIVL